MLQGMMACRHRGVAVLGSSGYLLAALTLPKGSTTNAGCRYVQ